MDVAVITTSVNQRPSSYKRWAIVGKLIVAGDTNTPPALVDYLGELGAVYLEPQLQAHAQCSDVIGWQSIQRRNLALLHALGGDFDVIITVDDDNDPGAPVPYRTDILRCLGEEAIVSVRGTWNPGQLCTPNVRARGLSHIRSQRLQGCVATPLAAYQSLWLGDADVSSVDRLAGVASQVAAVWTNLNVAFAEGYVPVNSQATAWLREYAPLAAVLPGCGRYDDIWGGYVAERILRDLGRGIGFGHPVVCQVRNEHDLVRDIEQELFGLRHTDTLLDALDALQLTDGHSVIEHYEAVADYLQPFSWFPTQAARFMHHWVKDVRACA